MLSGADALAYLESASGKPEAGRSAYWERQVGRFSVDADGAVAGSTPLGSVSRKTGALHTMSHRILQFPYRRMGRSFRDFGDCERTGREVARRQGRQFTHDMIRQVLTLSLIRHHLDPGDPSDCNLIIGDGYGVMTSLLLLGPPRRRCLLVNLTKPLLLDLAFVAKAVPGIRFALVADEAGMSEALAARDANLIAVQADNAGILGLAPIGLAVNVVSMQEMEAGSIAGYFRTLRSNRARETAFYCCNKLWKKTGDGIGFNDYPWLPEDRILVDAACPWSMLTYTKTPPFWRRKSHLRPIQHRLAIMAKEPR